jgi:uncharacterized membrane protein YheB (UPF0754 family)
MNNWIFILPLIAAMAGWCINKLFIWLLLYRILPKRLPGLAQKLGKLAQEEFLSMGIEKKISDPANLEKAMPVIESHVDNCLRNKLKEQMPMVGMFIGDKTIQTMKTVFIKELENLFPEVMNQFAGNMKNQLDIEKIVSSKILSISSEKIEKMMAKELRFMALAGAVTGFLVGLLQVIIALLIY